MKSNIINMLNNCKDETILKKVESLLKEDVDSKYWKSMRNKLKEELRSNNIEIGKVLFNMDKKPKSLVVSFSKVDGETLIKVQSIVESFLFKNKIKCDQVEYVTICKDKIKKYNS